MDTKGLQKEFINWCKSKNKLPKSEDETKQLFVAFMKEKHPEEYKKAVENQQKQQQAQAQKALHGAKLNYFRTLKNQCAEDEEVVYYKKGGSVNCGCKKKEEGGEVRKAGLGCSAAIEKFKKMRTGGNTVVNGSTKLPTIDGTKKMLEDPNKDMTWDPKLRKMRKMTPEEIARAAKNRADARQGKGEGTPQHKCGGKVKKGEDGLLPIKYPKGKPSKNTNRGGIKSKLPVQSKGSKINKDCGGAVAKFKALRKGGSLNGIPFMLGGTPKGGIEKSDNTRVRRILNNGEAVYERTPVGYGDFLPLVGTYRAALRIDKGEPNASYGDLIVNGAMDALGAGMVGSVAKALIKANKIIKALKNRGYRQITKEPTHWYKDPINVNIGYGDQFHSFNITNPGFKRIPNVDYYNVAMQPMIQTLRVPATAPFK